MYLGCIQIYATSQILINDHPIDRYKFITY
jgi:hypothetical protein